MREGALATFAETYEPAPSTPQVSGNFHVAMGDSYDRDGRHIHQFLPSEVGTWNASHAVHSISFGSPFPGQSSPLSGRRQTVADGSATYQYFVKIVPTTYHFRNGSKIETNQYSVNEAAKLIPADPNARSAVALPGVFVAYEISPFLVEAREESVAFSAFLTRVI